MKNMKDWLGCPAMDAAMDQIVDTAEGRATAAGLGKVTAMAVLVHLEGGEIATVRVGCECPGTLMGMMEALGKAFGAEVDIVKPFSETPVH